MDKSINNINYIQYINDYLVNYITYIFYFIYKFLVIVVYYICLYNKNKQWLKTLNLIR